MVLQTKCKVDAGQEVLVSHKTFTQLTPTRLIKMLSFCFHFHYFSRFAPGPRLSALCASSLSALSCVVHFVVCECIL